MDSNEVNLLVRNFNLSMQCLPSGTDLQYKWYRRNGSLPASADGVDTPIMTIYRLTPEDAGDYQCILSNVSGVIASEFDTLTVNGTNTCITLYYVHICNWPARTIHICTNNTCSENDAFSFTVYNTQFL